MVRAPEVSTLPSDIDEQILHRAKGSGRTPRVGEISALLEAPLVHRIGDDSRCLELVGIDQHVPAADPDRVRPELSRNVADQPRHRD
jgi:hypothetical protein